MKYGLFAKLILINYVVSFLIIQPVSFVFANPEGAQVVAGEADFVEDGNTLNITTSDKVIIDYDSFSIAGEESVIFKQPFTASLALNRVRGGSISEILGTLSANGRVMLINQNGILFGPNSVVDTGGFIASSLNISDSDFLNDKFNFLGIGGEIINNGRITAREGGLIAFFAPTVTNNGIIETQKGRVAIGAGTKVNVDFIGDGLITFNIEESVIDSSIINTGVISAKSGQVELSVQDANNIVKGVINNSGLISANKLVNEGGVVRLIGSKNSTIINTGTIEASGKNDGINGGDVTLCGGAVINNGSIIANAISNANAGNVNLLADKEARLEDNSLIEVKGELFEANGGNVLIDSGDSVYMSEGQVIDISGGKQGGHGGEGLVLAEGVTQAGGNVIGNAMAGYNRGRFEIDPDTIISLDYTSSADNYWWAKDDVLIQANVTGTDGAGYWFLADHKSADPDDWQNAGGGDVILDAGKTVSTDTGNLTFMGERVTLNGKVATGGKVLLEGRKGILLDNVNNEIANLHAYNKTSGDIVIKNKTSLNLVDNNGNGFAIRNNAGGGDVNVTTSSGDLIVRGTINTKTGAVNLDSAGETQLGNNITTNSGAITFSDNIILIVDDISIASNGGDIDFQGAVNADDESNIRNLELTADGGDINFGDEIGDDEKLDNVVITNAKDVIFKAVNLDGKLEQEEGTGSTTIGNSVTTGGIVDLKNNAINVNNLITGNGGVTLTGTIKLASSISTSGDLIKLDGDITRISTSGVTLNSSGGDIEITGKLDADDVNATRNLTIIANNGDVTFGNNIGDIKALDNILIASADNVSFNSVTLDGSLTQNSGSGATTFDGAVNVGNEVNISTDTIDINSSITAVNQVILNADKLVKIGADITTTDENIEISGNILRDNKDDVTLSTGAGSGDIIINNTINADSDTRNLSLNSAAGEVQINGAIGDAQKLNKLTITTGQELFIDSAVKVNELIVKTLNDNGADITIDSDNNDVGTINLQARTADDSSNADGDITYKDSNGVVVASINTTALAKLIAGDDITQSGAINADTLEVKTVNNSGADITLNHADNSVNKIKFEAKTTSDTNSDGDIDYTNNKSMTLTEISTAGDVDVKVTSGDLTVVSVNANNADLTAENSILDDDVDTTNIKVTNTLNLTAQTGNIGTDSNVVGMPAGFLDVDAQAGLANINVSSAGSARVNYQNISNINSSDINITNINGTQIGIGVDDGDFTFDDGTLDGIDNDVKIIANNIYLNRDSSAGEDIEAAGDVELRAINGEIAENKINDGVKTWTQFFKSNLEDAPKGSALDEFNSKLVYFGDSLFSGFLSFASLDMDDKDEAAYAYQDVDELVEDIYSIKN